MERAAELLMPAGSLEKLKVAILYGADAVSVGAPDLSLRTRSNFTLGGVLEGVAFAHDHGKRAHLTLNLFSHNRDIEKLPDSVAHLSEIEARLHVKGASLKVIKPELDTQRRSAASSSTWSAPSLNSSMRSCSRHVAEVYYPLP